MLSKKDNISLTSRACTAVRPEGVYWALIAYTTGPSILGNLLIFGAVVAMLYMLPAEAEETEGTLGDAEQGGAAPCYGSIGDGGIVVPQQPLPEQQPCMEPCAPLPEQQPCVHPCAAPRTPTKV